MEEVYLITFQDFIPYQELSFNIDADKTMKPFILQAQIADLLPLLGSAFYYDLISNNTSVAYQDLLNGKNYTTTNSEFPIAFLGLKPYLCYSAFARYASRANIKSTATGFKIKTNEFSENADWKQIQTLIDQSISLAKIYESGIAQYLYHNKVNYPVISAVSSFDCCEGSLWTYGCFNNKRGGKSRLTVVG